MRTILRSPSLDVLCLSHFVLPLVELDMGRKVRLWFCLSPQNAGFPQKVSPRNLESVCRCRIWLGDHVGRKMVALIHVVWAARDRQGLELPPGRVMP